MYWSKCCPPVATSLFLAREADETIFGNGGPDPDDPRTQRIGSLDRGRGK